MRDELNLTIEKLKERTQQKGDIIREITIAPQTIYCRTYNSTSVAEKTNLLRDTALEAMRLHGTDTTRRMYFTEYSANAPEEISYCVAVPQGSNGEYVSIIPELKAISFFHHGAYEEIPEARKRLISYAEENNLTLTGVFRNIFLEGPPQHKDTSKFITQIIAVIE
jgi:effector-binding domain-containing protein